MSIVKIKNQSGITYAYEATSNWDPVKKQSRPVRKYLGRVDEETGEIIPTAGRRGRPRKKADDDSYKALYSEATRELKEARAEIERLREEQASLTERISQLAAVLTAIHTETAPFAK